MGASLLALAKSIHYHCHPKETLVGMKLVTTASSSAVT